MAGRVQADLTSIIISKLIDRGLSPGEARSVAAMPEVQKIAKDNYERQVPVPSKFTSLGKKDIEEFRKAPDFTQAVGSKLFWNGQPSREAYQASQAPAAPSKPPIGFASAPQRSGRWPDLAGQPNALNAPASQDWQVLSAPTPPTIQELQTTGGHIRSMPVNDQTRNWLSAGAAATGLVPVVTSGGQPTSGPRRTGSHRHDLGGAADFELKDPQTGRILDMTIPADQARMSQFVQAGVAAGATGVGASPGYMGNSTIHMGGGTPAVWKSQPWVKEAWQAGRDHPSPYTSALKLDTKNMMPAQPIEGGGITTPLASMFGSPPPPPAVAATSAPPSMAQPVSMNPGMPLRRPPTLSPAGFPAPSPAGTGLQVHNLPPGYPGMPLRRPTPPPMQPGMNPGMPLRRPPMPTSPMMGPPPGTSMMGAMGRPTFPNQGLAGGVGNLFNMAQPIGGMGPRAPSVPPMLAGLAGRSPIPPAMSMSPVPPGALSPSAMPTAPGMAAYGMSPHSGTPSAASAVAGGIAAVGQAAAQLSEGSGQPLIHDLLNSKASGIRNPMPRVQNMPMPIYHAPLRPPVRRPIPIPFRPYGW